MSYLQVKSAPEFREVEKTLHDGKKIKVHRIRIKCGNSMVDEVVTEANKAEYAKEYAKFVDSLGSKGKKKGTKDDEE